MRAAPGRGAVGAAWGSAILWRWWEAGERRLGESPRGRPAAERAEPSAELSGELTEVGAARRAAPPRVVVPRWVQLVLLPLALLALWALAKAAGKVLLIFIVAGLIALILNPAVAFLHRARLPRGLAVLAVYLAFFLTLAGIGFLLANPISNQVRTFTRQPAAHRQRSQQTIASVQSELNHHGIHLKLVKQGKTALQSIEGKVAKSAEQTRLVRRRAC